MQNQSNSLITFDTQLKTTLSLVHLIWLGDVTVRFQISDYMFSQLSDFTVRFQP